MKQKWSGCSWQPFPQSQKTHLSMYAYKGYFFEFQSEVLNYNETNALQTGYQTILENFVWEPK